MTRQERIEDLQDKVQHRRIMIDELEKECEDHGIIMYDEVLEPIECNLCDRCGDYGDTYEDFLWVDCFNWDEDNPRDKAVIKAMEQEGIDYCAICWECVNKLAKKGGYNENHNA